MPFSRDMGHVCTLYQGKRGWNCWQRGGYDWLMGKETNRGGCRPQLLIIFGANSCGERRRQEQATERADAPPDLPARHVVVCVGQASTRVLRRVLAGASKSQSVSHQSSACPRLPLHYSRPFLVMASSVLKQVCITPDSIPHQY